MRDALKMAEEFLQKKHTERPEIASETVHPISSFRSMFAFRDLSDIEKMSLSNMMRAHLSTRDPVVFEKDFRVLSQLTAELKSIQKQAVILVGERVVKARTILHAYGGQRTFTRWLDTAFQSRKTAYNALAFYDFYCSLSDDRLRANFKQMPMKASYILASRKGAKTLKEKIISGYHGEKQDEMIERIQVLLPVKAADRRSKEDIWAKLLHEMGEKITSLENSPKNLDISHVEAIQKYIHRLEQLLDARSCLLRNGSVSAE